MLSKLNQRAALAAPVFVPDGGGGYSATWQTFATVWAAIEPITGGDVFGPDAEESRVRFRITIDGAEPGNGHGADVDAAVFSAFTPAATDLTTSALNAALVQEAEVG